LRHVREELRLGWHSRFGALVTLHQQHESHRRFSCSGLYPRDERDEPGSTGPQIFSRLGSKILKLLLFHWPVGTWPIGQRARRLGRMREHCEVCEAFRPEGAAVSEEKLVYVEFTARTVRLCVGHALIAQNSGVHSFEELRELYGSGRR